MTLSNDLMELKEDKIREKYKLAEAMLEGFDHTPRIAKKSEPDRVSSERSPGLGSRRRFRSTTPALSPVRRRAPKASSCRSASWRATTTR